MASPPRVNPSVDERIKVGLNVCVSLIVNSCAQPLFGPLPQGSVKFLKQLYGVLLFHSFEYFTLTRFFSLKRWSILMSNWSLLLREAPEVIQLSYRVPPAIFAVGNSAIIFCATGSIR